MEAPKPLHGGDFSIGQRLDRFLKRILPCGEGPSPGVPQGKGGAASGAGRGLGVEAAVPGILVFPKAIRAKFETFHGRMRPVVGEGFDDGKTRSAVAAV